MSHRLIRLSNARLSQDDASSLQHYLLLQTSLAFQLLFFFIFLSTTGMLSADSSEITLLSTRNKPTGTKQPIRNGNSENISLDLHAADLFISGSDQIRAAEIQRLDKFFHKAVADSVIVRIRYRFVPEVGSLYQQNSIWNDGLLRLAALQRFATDRGVPADRIDAGVEPLVSASTDSNPMEHSLVQLSLRPAAEQNLEGAN